MLLVKVCQRALVDASGMIINYIRQWTCHSLLKEKGNNSSSFASKLLGIVTGYY
jgi:hypothetical protein